MNKLLLVALLLAGFPLTSFADSYDGPYCYENPGIISSATPEEKNFRGTCKFVDVKTSVSLDASLASDYILGTHNSIPYACERGCTYTRFSEILYPYPNQTTVVLDSLILSKEDTGWMGYEATPSFSDLFVLLDKEGVLNYIQTHNIEPGTGIVVLNESEMSNVYWYVQSTTVTYKDLLALFKDNKDPITVRNFPITGTSTATYTFDHKTLGSYIQSVKNPYAENWIYQNSYIRLDDTQLPPDIGLSKTYIRGSLEPGYILPVTNPAEVVKDYWTFVMDNNEIVLAWQKTEYTLDDGSIKTVHRKGLPGVHSEKDSVSPTDTSLVTSPADEQSSTNIPKESFLERVWRTILSWFN